MESTPILTGCACCGVSRRNFLASGCAACAGALGLMTASRPVFAASAGNKPRIRILYSLHAETQPGPDWPNVGFAFGPVMEQINTVLANSCPEFEFVPSMATGPEEAAAIIKEDAPESILGYIVYQLNCWNRVVQTVAETGKPTLYVDFQFGGSGGFLVYTADFLRKQTPNVGFAASSRMDDVIAAVKCFKTVLDGGAPAAFVAATAQARRGCTPPPGDLGCLPDPLKTLSTTECIERMKTSKILVVRDQESKALDPYMGIPMVQVAFSELNALWESADKDEARAVADRWEKRASSITDVTRETLETSAAMYLANKALLAKYDANAITINCLGGFYGNHIHAYPCLGFHELNNEGLVGACEADVRSTATMTTFTALTQGRPGYISDPVVDTAKRQIIYAHCVASNRAFGPAGIENPFSILTHSEDRQGAAVRSLLPSGYMTTSLEVSPERKEILFHQAKAVANDPDDRACRTKLCAEPIGDIEKLFTQWDQWGWHRVTFYGDLKEPVFALADALGYTVVEEA
ncbi:MAG: hypothetical protein GXY07_00200 [Candidatus Hydrogenedentes bacterium]|nr:hypothetical protein [Candidatus Hydrogenedentota bacterium]